MPIRKTALATLLLTLTAGTVSADVTVTERGRIESKIEPGKASRSILLKGSGGGSSLIDGSGLEYFINTDVTFSTAESASGSASDATYTAAVTASTSGGGTTVTTLSDAFDGYNGVCFATGPGLGECDPDGPGFTVYNENGPATLGCEDCELITPPQTIGNLEVSRRVFVPDHDEFIRFMTIVTNVGAAPEIVYFVTANNLGSDSNTEVYATSSGDETVTPDDDWIASFEAFDGSGLSSDPRLGHVIQGPGAPVRVSSISFSDGQNQPFWEYEFTLQPGETAIVLNFATGQPNRPDAVAKAQELALLPPIALECMSAEEISQVVNFATAEGIDPAEIPTAGEYGLAAFALLLLAAGTLAIRRLG